MSYPVTVTANGKEVHGLKKLRYMTIGEIVHYFIRIPIYDAVWWMVDKIDSWLELLH